VQFQFACADSDGSSIIGKEEFAEINEIVANGTPKGFIYTRQFEKFASRENESDPFRMTMLDYCKFVQHNRWVVGGLSCLLLLLFPCSLCALSLTPFLSPACTCAYPRCGVVWCGVLGRSALWSLEEIQMALRQMCMGDDYWLNKIEQFRVVRKQVRLALCVVCVCVFVMG